MNCYGFFWFFLPRCKRNMNALSVFPWNVQPPKNISRERDGFCWNQKTVAVPEHSVPRAICHPLYPPRPATWNVWFPVRPLPNKSLHQMIYRTLIDWKIETQHNFLLPKGYPIHLNTPSPFSTPQIPYSTHFNDSITHYGLSPYFLILMKGALSWYPQCFWSSKLHPNLEPDQLGVTYMMG